MEVDLIQIEDHIYIDVPTLPNDVVCGKGYFDNTTLNRFYIYFVATMIDDIIYTHYSYSMFYQPIIDSYELFIKELQNNILSVSILPNTITIKFITEKKPLILGIHNNKDTGLPNGLFQYVEELFSDKNYVLK